jgi:benzoyl-CoA-dihydrodiol lyase
MLGLSSHAWKVNFCKFTNETRNAIEDASRNSGLKFIAACNGSTAGGGYEIALACDEIILVDDRSSAVSLPELALLGVLPGTGGLTRLIDKRKVRRDQADVFCTIPEGLQGQRARDWHLVDHVAKPQEFKNVVARRAAELARQSDRPVGSPGVALIPLERVIDGEGYHYKYVDARVNHGDRTATLTIRAPETNGPATLEEILQAGARWWPLQMARELDDAILTLRSNDLPVGLWLVKTKGDAQTVLRMDQLVMQHRSNWFVREVLGMLRRTLARLEVSARSIYAIVEPGSCFAACLLELALAADRVYMVDQADAATSPVLVLSEINFGLLPSISGVSRLAGRFQGDHGHENAIRARIGEPLNARQALDLGLVTFAPDELDWADEIRQAIESRTTFSPDGLTGLEANLRFTTAETMETRIFGRLSAWQNWIFVRPNAVSQSGALKVYGTGSKAKFDWERV